MRNVILVMNYLTFTYNFYKLVITFINLNVNVVDRPTHGLDPPGMALNRANAQQWRCPADGPLSPPGGSLALVCAKQQTRARPAYSAIAAHLVVTGPSRADPNHSWDDLRRELFKSCARSPEPLAFEKLIV